jgi:hypothetical protein
MCKSISALGVCLGLLSASLADDEVKYVKLVHAENGKVLAGANNSEKAGARVVVAKDEGSEAQQWKLEKDGDYLKLTNRKSGKVLDVSKESMEEGAWIIVWEDKAEGNDNQRWLWEGDGPTRRLKSKHSGRVLDVEDDGTVVQRSLAEKAQAQLWKVVEVQGKPSR